MAIVKMNIDRPEIKKGEHRVFIVDDHPIVRRGLEQLINQESDLSVCGDAGSIPQALKAIENSEPDITIVGIDLGHSSGISLLKDLTRYYPGVSTLVYSMHNESVYAERCLRAGAKGYIMKNEPFENVVSALRKILEGEMYISRKIRRELLDKILIKKSEACGSLVDLLSNRELEVFHLVGQGLKIQKIAENSNLSISTIESHVYNIRKKMNFRNIRELFVHAAKFVNEA